MLSRVECLEQVFILNKLDVSKIQISGQALFELERLEDISFNKNLTPWYNVDALHVASLNCAGLMAHIDDIRNDHKLLQADIIHLQEISLPMDHQGKDVCQLPGYEASFICNGKGKGIGSFKRCGTVSTRIKEENFQVSCLESNGVKFINVYRSQNGCFDSLLEKLNEEIDTG